MSLSTLRYSTPIYEENNCWFNAANNLKHYRLNGKDLHLVLGAHAQLNDPTNIGPKTAQFNGIIPTSKTTWEVREEAMWKEPEFSHGWLEDEDGNVYDYIYRGKAKGIIEGESKESLSHRGLHYCYVTAPTETMLFGKVTTHLAECWAKNLDVRKKIIKMAEKDKDDYDRAETADALLLVEQQKVTYKNLQEAWMARKGK
jgi:hypothetical protein